MHNPDSTNNGLKSIPSAHNVKETTDRLEKVLTKKGLSLIARINHTAAAEKIDELLRPTELVIFGNPKAGTPLMQSSQSVAIDLPQKILVWEDENEKVWLSYNDPNYLVNRHGITGCKELINNINVALNTIAQECSK